MTHADYQSRPYLPELDGLRALCILIVITVHAKDRVWGWLGGNLGVTIFFVLSGYLITMLALREERTRGALNIPAFFTRRAFRLFPLYYAVLGLYCLLIFGLRWSPEKREMLAGALPYYLFYFQEYPFFMGVGGSRINVPFYQSWSLGIEEKFYLIWPFIGFVAWRQARAVRLVGTAALGALAMLSPALLGPDVGQFFFSYAHILVGCVVALLLDDPAWFARLRWLGRPAAGALATIALLGVHFAWPYSTPPWRWGVDALYSLTVAVFLMTLLLGEGAVRRALRLPALVLIGRLSYGMYLIHLFAINVADKVVRPGSGSFAHALASYLIASLVAVAMAYLLSVTIERPFIAVGRRLSAQLQHRRAEQPAVEAAPRPA